MNVKVRYRLSRRFSNVDADVEAVGLVLIAVWRNATSGGVAERSSGGREVLLFVHFFLCFPCARWL